MYKARQSTEAPRLRSNRGVTCMLDKNRLSLLQLHNTCWQGVSALFCCTTAVRVYQSGHQRSLPKALARKYNLPTRAEEQLRPARGCRPGGDGHDRTWKGFCGAAWKPAVGSVRI